MAQNEESTELNLDPTNPRATTQRARAYVGSLIVSMVTLVAVLTTLDPADYRPSLPQGPGITLDESFNVQMGVYLVESLKNYGLGILDPNSIEEVFGNPGYNPDHPPLGRLWLGAFHEISRSVAPVDSGDNPFVTIHARAGSAVAFALTVLLIGAFATRRWGSLEGVTSSVSLAVMPRLFGHAHLASLETFMGLTWTVAILGMIQIWIRRTESSSDDDSISDEPVVTKSEPPGDKAAILCGLLIGLALLTKMQAILLPPLVAVWAVWHWRLAAIRPLIVSGVSTAVVFVVGWPWLWLDLPGHLTEYFGRTTGRVSLNVWYLGQVFNDVDAPWHYPWVMTLVTVPVGILLMAAVGLWGARRRILNDPTTSLIVGSVIAPLVLFSLPGVAVYDGARLFLIAFPGIALLAGSSVVSISEWGANFQRPVVPVIVLVLATQTAGIVKATPCHLSYYSAAVGGTRGAEKLGFEVTYWGDSFSRDFLKHLKKVAGNSIVQVAPVLHQFQLKELERQVPFLTRRAALTVPPLELVPFGTEVRLTRPTLYFRDPSTLAFRNYTAEFLAVFHRRADAPSPDLLEQAGWELVNSETCQGVVVASLWSRSSSSSSAAR